MKSKKAYTTYKFRAYPAKGVQKRLRKTMRKMAEIWNIALKERQDTYEQSKQNPEIKPVNSYFTQYALIRKGDHPEFAKYDAQSMQDVLVKLDGSYKSFFRLIKKDPLARPPKEKNFHPVLIYRKSGWQLNGNRLELRNIGSIRLRIHRQIEGKVKTVTVRLKNNKWYVCFSCELSEVPAVQKQGESVKIEFKDECFLTDGEAIIQHPEFYFNEIARLKRLSRSLSRKKKGSHNRRQVKYTLHKFHERIAERRLHFLHSLANNYVDKFAEIYIPKMPLKQKIMQATTSRQAMRLCDAAYGIFCELLKQKAQKNGVKVIDYAL